jgi:hypothetical protein
MSRPRGARTSGAVVDFTAPASDDGLAAATLGSASYRLECVEVAEDLVRMCACVGHAVRLRDPALRIDQEGPALSLVRRTLLR